MYVLKQLGKKKCYREEGIKHLSVFLWDKAEGAEITGEEIWVDFPNSLSKRDNN